MISISSASSLLVITGKAQSLLRPEFWRSQLERAEAALLGGIVQAVVILVLFLVARTVIFRLVDGLVVPILTREQEKGGPGRAARVKTLQGILKSVLNYTLIFMAVVALLQGFGIGIGGIIASAGVLGLAVGFGAQKLVRDVISGFFLLLENQFSVGDYVTVGAVSGVVEEIGMRTTQLRDDLGRMCFISNGDIGQVCNHSRGPAVAVVDIGVASSTSIEALQEVIAKVSNELVGPEGMLESAPELDGLVSADAAKFVLRVKAKTAPGKRAAAEMSLREALVRNIREAGISLA